MFYFSLLHLSVILHFASIQFKRSGLFYSFRTKKILYPSFIPNCIFFFSLYAVCVYVYFSLFSWHFFMHSFRSGLWRSIWFHPRYIAAAVAPLSAWAFEFVHGIHTNLHTISVAHIHSHLYSHKIVHIEKAAMMALT